MPYERPGFEEIVRRLVDVEARMRHAGLLSPAAPQGLAAAAAAAAETGETAVTATAVATKAAVTAAAAATAAGIDVGATEQRHGGGVTATAAAATTAAGTGAQAAVAVVAAGPRTSAPPMVTVPRRQEAGLGTGLAPLPAAAVVGIAGQQAGGVRAAEDGPGVMMAGVRALAAAPGAEAGAAAAAARAESFTFDTGRQLPAAAPEFETAPFRSSRVPGPMQG